MMPSMSFASSSPSSVSTTARVDKATSELLVGPDWTMNMEICDLCNSNHWMAKDMVKGVKRRLQHKNPRVQLLTLTLLETMVKNCGEYIHFQIAERKILDEMVKIVKKKGDMHVRNKILILLDSWQEAFGGPGGKYSQYYWACDELRRSGVHFPPRPERSPPVITPPVTHPPRVSQIGFGMPSDSSQRLDEAMTAEVEGLSFSTLESMRNALELLSDMLQAVNPSDRMAVKDEIIVELVERCRANQKKLMQMITTATDEELLSQGLETNDSLQSVLAKHDAIASGAPLPDLGKRNSTQQSESVDSNTKPSEAGDKHSTANDKSPVSPARVTKDQVEEGEEEDEFALLARRHSKTQSGPSQSGTSGVTEDGASSSGSNNALALIDPAAPATSTNVSKDQDLIDLLSLALTTTSTSTSDTTEVPSSAPVQSTAETSMNSYVVPWANAQPQPQPQPLQNQYQPGYYQYASAYPPPPWEQASGYNIQNLGSNPYMYPNYQGNMNNISVPAQGAFQYTQYGNQPLYSTAQPSSNFPPQTNQHTNSFQNPPSPTMSGNLYSASVPTNNMSSTPTQGAGSLQHTNSFTSKVSNPLALNGASLVTNGSASAPLGEKPFVPSYRLFEDLNVFGSSEGKLKNGPYPSASGNSQQNMISGRR